VSRGRLLAVAGALAAFLVTYLLLTRSPPSPEEQIRRKAVAMADAAERKDLGLIMKQVSARFRGEGGLSRDEARAFLAGQLLRGEWVRVLTAGVEVTLTSPSTADFKGTYIFGRSEAKLLKDLARESVVASYEITARVEKEADGEWRFVSASWRRVDPGSLF